MNGHSFPSKKAQKVIIYWDYENCPIPNKATSFGNVWNTIQRRIFSYLQYEVQVEAKVYIAAHKLPYKIKQGMDVCGARNIDVPSLKPEAVDKRMLVDLALDLYQWKGHNICNAVVLISGDKDFGNILGRIHNTPEIAKLILIRLPKNDGAELPVNKNLYSSVDFIVDNNHGNGFAVTEFIDCRYGMTCKQTMNGKCKFYHHGMVLNNHIHQNNPSSVPNANSYRSPASSISNTSISGDDHKNDEQDNDVVMSQKTLEIRSKMACRHGNKCHNWKNGNCHYFHAKPYAVYNRPKAMNNTNTTPCNKGNDCQFWKQGKCHFYHASPYSAHPQHQDVVMNNNGNNNHQQQLNDMNYVPSIANAPKAKAQPQSQPPSVAAGGAPPPNPYQVKQQIQHQVLDQQQSHNNNGNSSQNQSNLDIITGDIVWNAYIDKHGNEPSNAQYLLNFSKRDASITSLSFKTAKETYNRNKGKGRI